LPEKEQIRAIPCEVYSRIVGYYRPVDSWNRGKKEEFKQRVVAELPGEAGLEEISETSSDEHSHGTGASKFGGALVASLGA
jgi:hypothetical protein